MSKIYQAAIRAALIVLGSAAVAWGIYALPVFWRLSAIENVAIRVIEGDRFKADVLTALTTQLDTAETANPCIPAGAHSAAVIWTRSAELAVSDGRDIDSKLNALRDAIYRSLACSPADPFLWVVLYWVESNRNGFRPDYVEYLRLSYQLGPNEGWIALRRNGYALAIFRQLPPELAQSVTAEFANLLNSGFDAEVFKIFKGPGWSHRAVLLPQLEDVAKVQREAFAKTLYKEGYDVVVPGIAPRDPRPWD